ncbi:MAG: SDR family oxidoreductase [Desulfobacterales bacterium]|nr:SDR family oxidoreductase [Desulfobacterales bacterium]MBF0395512.1 SDR family oxidoreductase [Desulfobacterales bacterium]
MKKIKGSWALITGASSGLGAEFAKLLSKNGVNLVLTARRTEKLKELKDSLEQKNHVSVHTISNDLSSNNGASLLYKDVCSLNVPISILINNAGVGLNGRFKDMSLEDHMSMVKLNVLSLTELTHLFVTDMLKKKIRGYILLLSSVVGFGPCPNFSAYAATKAYVLSLAESLNHELKSEGISVTALCPGPTRTEFFSTAKGSPGKVLQTFMMEPEEVASEGLKGMFARNRVVVPGLITKISASSNRWLPKSILLKIADKLG